MARNVRIYANRPGFLLEGVNVYYGSQSADYLLAENLSYDEWADGFVARIPDETTTIIAVCMTGSCAGQSSSQAIPPKVENVRFLIAEVTGSGGRVSFSYPEVVVAANRVTQSVDFRDYSQARVLAHPSPNYALVGWYTASADNEFITSNQPLTITRNFYNLTDKFYAKFSNFTLSATTASVGVSGSVTLNLQTRNYPDGTQIPFTASGLNNRHLSSGSLTGSFLLTNNSGSHTITIGELTSSLTTEFNVSLTNTSASALTVGVISQSYDISGSISSSYQTTSSFEVYTTGHKDGDEIEFRVEAISASVSGSILGSGSDSGSFFVHSNTGSYQFALTTSEFTGSNNIFNLYLLDKPYISHSITLFSGSI
jgi:hypothetical protein